MAIITKIRDRTVLVLFIVGLALAAFILGDLFSSNAALFGPGEQIAGEINGKSIPLQDFAARVERYNNELELKSGSSLPASQMGFVRNQVWDNILSEVAYKLDEMGIQVSDDEIRDMVQGNNVHPEVVALFTNPQTQEFDRQILFSFLQSPDRYPAEVRQLFAVIESGLREKRRKEKYLGMMHHTNYVSEAEAKKRYYEKTATADIDVFFVPFTAIPDSAISVTEDEIKAHFKKNESQYRSDAMVSFEYVQFRIVPSATDSAEIFEELQDLKKPFENTTDDTLFTAQYSDARQGIRSFNRSELPKVFDGQDLVPGMVLGPVLEGNNYSLYKFIGRSEDTVFSARASHILFGTNPNMSQEERDQKKSDAERILKEIKDGGDFALLAAQYGEDGTRSRGGDLGWFRGGQMVPDFEKPVFAANNVGVLPELVETQFGYHIVSVTGTKTKERFEVGIVSRVIEATEETRNEAFRKAGRFAVSKSMDDYVAQLKKSLEAGEEIISNQANKVGKDQSFINDMNDYTGVRNLINWAFKSETRPGNVSDVTEVGDRFVVAVLVEKVSEDNVVPPLSIVREEVRRDLLKDKKAEIILAKINEKSGASFEELQKLYERASVISQEGVTPSFVSLRTVGAAPEIIGRTFAQEVGTNSAPFRDENGIAILRVIKREEPSEVADHQQYKTVIAQERAQSILTTGLKANKAVTEITNAKKFLHKFY
ncbi:MAG: SurA N-terminal domain-containing protein [Bernardetiaceae bacterium]